MKVAIRVLAPRRAGRCSERGLTLIEMVVTIVLIGAGVVGVMGGITAAERSATIRYNVAASSSAIVADLIVVSLTVLQYSGR